MFLSSPSYQVPLRIFQVPLLCHDCLLYCFRRKPVAQSQQTQSQQGGSHMQPISHCDGFIPQTLFSNKFCCKLCEPKLASTTLDSLSVGFIQNPYAKSMC